MTDGTDGKYAQLISRNCSKGIKKQQDELCSMFIWQKMAN